MNPPDLKPVEYDGDGAVFGMELGLLQADRPALFEHPQETALLEDVPECGRTQTADLTGKADPHIFPGRLRGENLKN